MARRYLTLPEVAEYLRMSPKTIRRLIKRPVDPLPFRRPSGVYLFEQGRVDTWWDRQPGRDGDDLSN
jgi:excisionase family DNA binding protein